MKQFLTNLLIASVIWGMGTSIAFAARSVEEKLAPDKDNSSPNHEIANAPPAPINPLAFKLRYSYRSGGQGEFLPLREGSVLRSGDHLKLLFEPTETCYVYIYQIDSASKIARLFPSGNFEGADRANQNPVRSGKTYFVPAEKKSFVLDKQQGKETIYFVVSRQPDDHLEKRYQMALASNTRSLEARREVQQQWEAELMRLVNPQLANDISGKPINPVTGQEETEVVQGGQKIKKVETFSITPQYLENVCVGCTYQLTFEHR